MSISRFDGLLVSSSLVGETPAIAMNGMNALSITLTSPVVSTTTSFLLTLFRSDDAINWTSFASMTLTPSPTAGAPYAAAASAGRTGQLAPQGALTSAYVKLKLTTTSTQTGSFSMIVNSAID